MTFRIAHLDLALIIPVVVGLLATPARASAQHERHQGSSSGGRASSAPAPAPSSPKSGGTAAPRTEVKSTGQAKTQPGTTATAPHVRDSNGNPIIGTAVRRPAASGGSLFFGPSSYGFYPWGWGGLGLAGYYGGYYSGYFDPLYGGYYDPLYGGSYDPLGSGGQWYPTGGGGVPTYSGSGDDGALRLRVKPRDASVYVDGYFVGRIDDFDGWLQRLHLGAGSHHIEIRQAGYATLGFDVRILPGQTVTYHGDLTKQP
jgi:hypothetical protein